MLLFKDLSVERKREVVSYIKRNRNEDPALIAERFNISVSKVEVLKRKHSASKDFRPF